MFVNILTADSNYSRFNRENLMQPIQMQLSNKQKIFSGLFFAFLKSTLNFEHFQKKYDSHSWYISRVTDYEKCGWIIV